MKQVVLSCSAVRHESAEEVAAAREAARRAAAQARADAATRVGLPWPRPHAKRGVGRRSCPS